MQAIVLGSAAGGGVPQWNCGCAVCRLAWTGDRRVRPRTQSSLAASADGETWLLLNASPDIRQQIQATPALHPRRDRRHSPIAGVLLTNGDVDHVAGLLSLRENQPFRLFATADVLAALERNPVFDVLSRACVDRVAIAPGVPVEPVPGLAVTLFAVPGKAPVWLEGEVPVIGEETGGTVGVVLASGGRRIAYVPACAAVTDHMRGMVDGADVLLFDGTVLDDDDLIQAGVGPKTGWRMGHVPMRGPNGSIAALASTRLGQRIFVHINNTNPALIEGSTERAFVEAAGWAMAHDGLTTAL